MSDDLVRRRLQRSLVLGTLPEAQERYSADEVRDIVADERKAERKQFICDLMSLPTFTAEYDVATSMRHRAVSVEHVQGLIEKLRGEVGA